MTVNEEVILLVWFGMFAPSILLSIAFAYASVTERQAREKKK